MAGFNNWWPVQVVEDNEIQVCDITDMSITVGIKWISYLTLRNTFNFGLLLAEAERNC